MKTHLSTPSAGRRASAAAQFGFTLPELLIAVTIFVLLLAGLVGANLFGLRMFELTQIKLGMTGDARNAVGLMADDIRNCKSLWVGDVRDGTFVGHLDGELQTGAGVMIYPSANTNDFIVYYANSADQTLRRTTSTSGTARILAYSVTNRVVFSAQDSTGNVLTNYQNNRLIHVSLQFRQLHPQLPTADSYSMETSLVRRAL